MDPISSYLSRQDGIITRSQALEHISVSRLRHRLGRRWQIVLPGVYAGFTGELSQRQWLRAVLLYTGAGGLLTDLTALRYGVRYLPTDPRDFVLIPAAVKRSNHGRLVVRRTHRPPCRRVIDGLAYCPPERAVVDFAARNGDRRTAGAVIADAVQRGVADLARLWAELPHLSGPGARVARDAVTQVVLGARSAPEVDFVELCRTSAALPAPLLNPLLQLPGGVTVSPDALFVDAGVVHETNGRQAHAATADFDGMQARHDTMTAAGLIVLHNSPKRLVQEPDRVLAEVESCVARYAGRGLPAGAVLLRAAPPAGPSVPLPAA